MTGWFTDPDPRFRALFGARRLGTTCGVRRLTCHAGANTAPALSNSSCSKRRRQQRLAIRRAPARHGRRAPSRPAARAAAPASRGAARSSRSAATTTPGTSATRRPPAPSRRVPGISARWAASQRTTSVRGRATCARRPPGSGSAGWKRSVTGVRRRIGRVGGVGPDPRTRVARDDLGRRAGVVMNREEDVQARVLRRPSRSSCSAVSSGSTRTRSPPRRRETEPTSSPHSRGTPSSAALRGRSLRRSSSSAGACGGRSWAAGRPRAVGADARRSWRSERCQIPHRSPPRGGKRSTPAYPVCRCREH